MTYIYVKDKEGFVVKKQKSELLSDETVITKKEFDELSGNNFYKKYFTHGGARTGSGRKTKTGTVLKRQKRLTDKEIIFIDFARAHNLDYDKLMEMQQA